MPEALLAAVPPLEDVAAARSCISAPRFADAADSPAPAVLGVRTDVHLHSQEAAARFRLQDAALGSRSVDSTLRA